MRGFELEDVWGPYLAVAAGEAGLGAEWEDPGEAVLEGPCQVPGEPGGNSTHQVELGEQFGWLT